MNDLVKKGHTLALVILGDVRQSRLIDDRTSAQIGLRQIVERINSEKPDLLQIPFSISGGDEIQGLLTDPADMVAAIDFLDLSSSLFGFRFGAGWGTVATPPASRSWEMDGECFHRAREAIIRGKKEKRWVTVVGFGDESDRILDSVFRIMQVIRDGWTKRQRLAVATRKVKVTQTATAEKRGLDDSTISKMRKAARSQQIEEREESIPIRIRKMMADGR